MTVSGRWWHSSEGQESNGVRLGEGVVPLSSRRECEESKE